MHWNTTRSSNAGILHQLWSCTEAESWLIGTVRCMGNALQIERGLFHKLPVSPLSERNMFFRLRIMLFEGRFMTTALLVMGWGGMQWNFIRTLKIIKEKPKPKQHRSYLWMIESNLEAIVWMKPCFLLCTCLLQWDFSRICHLSGSRWNICLVWGGIKHFYSTSHLI